ncbi:MAG: hypothetical protein H8E72_08760 [Candidatus Marinimicrobia bacterium]|nr:hypothetical protein [Candidatus Neomarinimicrobiota bacterium]
MLDVNNIQKFSHLPLKIKFGLTVYPWKDCKPTSCAELSKPLSECKIAIVSSAGLYIKGVQEKFDYNVKGGDYSYRIIPNDVNMELLYDSHRSQTFDHTGIRNNPSTGLPIPQLTELVNDGFIGSLNHDHISLMGAITAPGRFIKRSIQPIIEMLLADKVDVVLFVPV